MNLPYPVNDEAVFSGRLLPPVIRISICCFLAAASLTHADPVADMKLLPRLEPIASCEWKRSLATVIFSTDGRRLVAGGGSSSEIGSKGEVKVWTVPELKEVHHFRKMGSTVGALKFLDGITLLCQTQFELFVWDLSDRGRLRSTMEPCLGLLENDTLMLRESSIRKETWSLGCNEVKTENRAPLPYGLQPDDLVAFSQDGCEFLKVSVKDPSKLTIHSSSDGKQQWELSAKELASRRIRVNRRTRFELNSRALVLENKDYDPAFLFASAGEGLRTMPPSAARAVTPEKWTLSPDGRLLVLPDASCERDNPGQLEVIDVKTGKVTQTLPNESPAYGSATRWWNSGFSGPGGYSAVAFSPDGKLAASVSPYYGNVRLYKVLPANND